MARTTRLLPLIAFSLTLAAQAAQAQGQRSTTEQRRAADSVGVARLVADSGGTAQVTLHRATGTARFVRAAPGGALGIQGRELAVSDAAKQSGSLQFLTDYGSVFGISSAAAELSAGRIAKDRQGGTHITYKQVYRGLPVFGAELKTHFDSAGRLTVANGTFIPGISVSPSPTRSAEAAAQTALARVQAELGRPAFGLATTPPTLMIYREGLAKGVPGPNHLAWFVEVGNRADVREFVYVDAHSGKVLDKITGIHDALNRRAFNAAGATAPGPSYPGTPFWVEGNPFPTGTVEADNMISASADAYNLFKNAFGRDSFDGKGATMDAIFNRGDTCPNASWNGLFISFCPGVTTDDVTAHEWSHAYTEYTDNLIYQWQPGALNEAYADIWGETVDRINGRGGDTPDAARSAGVCTAFTPSPPTVNITAPASIAGPRAAGGASFGPTTFSVAGDVVAVNDGSGTAIDGCETPFVNAAAVSGKIAFMDRGICGFAVKAKNAQLNGAIGVIIGNNVAGTAPGLGGSDPTVVIPTLSVSQSDGTTIKTQLALTTVSASLARGGTGSDNSVRWLMGEDSSAFNGAIRDMWTPTCYGHPGKVTDAQYVCAATPDSGGVHSNSGVPNHAYALLVDGGTYNGQSVAAIGLTKAAHIYFRAQSVYQGPASDFAEHADSLEQSCTDLVGVNLASLLTGAPSGESIGASDCAQVAKAALAVELRTPPTQCNFQPLLAQAPPPLCEAGGTASSLLADSFDGGKRVGVRWQVTNNGVTGDFTPRNWGVVTNLPSQRPGYAIFAAATGIGTCSPGGNEAGLQRLESPEITVPAGAAPRVTFDHWIATEPGYDGGNLKISVNGGAWQLVSAANFIYNPYNATLITAAAGNDNPLAGQAAFSGSDGGSVSGSWGRSIVNLAPYATANDKVKLRFEMSNDGCGGNVGWYLDDVRVYRCQP
ncbi:MAG: M4 family metallopeptidase [Chitinophagaceae bacterium]|nr:M4 family metallopeptidase [Rubrivivax sp.]